MELILRKKIFEHYTVEELKTLLPPRIFSQLCNEGGNLPWLSELTRLLDFSNIDYTVEDFKKDYTKYKDFVEIKTVFNILMKGISLREFRYFNKNITSLLKKGFYYNSHIFQSTEIEKYIVIDYDITPFKIEFYKNHIELYGEKEELENFRNKFKLKECVYYEKYKKSWHLALKGLLAEYIRIHEKKDTK